MRWVKQKTHCRCRRCDRRKLLPMHPDDYIRKRRCLWCGGDYRVDKWMQNRWKTYVTCNCDGYHFPHREGSKYCLFRKGSIRRLPGDADYHDVQADRELQYAYS